MNNIGTPDTIWAENLMFSEAVRLADPIIRDSLDNLQQFLATHPVPIFVVNMVNGLLGYGVDTPTRTTQLGIDIRNSFADITSTQ